MKKKMAEKNEKNQFPCVILKSYLSDYIFMNEKFLYSN